jgi:hypothetical protein
MPTSGLLCAILRSRSSPTGKTFALGAHVAVTYNYAANESHLCSNAVNVVTGPASVALKTINDVNNWLGRSQWNAMFQASSASSGLGGRFDPGPASRAAGRTRFPFLSQLSHPLA